MHSPARRRAYLIVSVLAFWLVESIRRLDRKSFGIARISKKTGEIEGWINLGRDKRPRYQVDGVTDQIFYRPRSTEIVGYRF